MATHIISELDTQLASLNSLKPPGASKGKIGSITQLCVNNIQAESSVVQSLYRALKKVSEYVGAPSNSSTSQVLYNMQRRRLTLPLFCTRHQPPTNLALCTSSTA